MNPFQNPTPVPTTHPGYYGPTPEIWLPTMGDLIIYILFGSLVIALVISISAFAWYPVSYTHLTLPTT